MVGVEEWGPGELVDAESNKGIARTAGRATGLVTTTMTTTRGIVRGSGNGETRREEEHDDATTEHELNRCPPRAAPLPRQLAPHAATPLRLAITTDDIDPSRCRAHEEEEDDC